MPRRTVLLLDNMSGKQGAHTTILLLLLIATLAALAAGFPEDVDSSGPLPFLQFTKGGIRVNFGGYHAQAGLGGLLTGSKQDGGLHASAGTPDGAHASAGLGGSLDGGPAGGLHARAGLGNGGPEAEAGLGGTLAGPKPRGELYAGSSRGGYDIDLYKGIVKSIEKTGDKRMKVITRSKKASDQASVVASSSASATNKQETVDKKEIPPSSSASASTATNSGSSIKNGGEVTGEDDSAERNESPARWYFRKRLRERVGPYAIGSVDQKQTNDPSTPDDPAQEDDKQQQQQPVITTTTTTTTEAPNRIQAGNQQTITKRPKLGLFARAAAAVADGNAETDANGQKPKSTLFDDIFNIPISALNAVNQLLRNHVGKK